MDRRKFLHRGSLAGLTLTGLTSFANDGALIDNTEQANRNAYSDDFTLNEATIAGLQEKMQKGTLTSEVITKLYLKRIVDVDKNGPALNAVIEVNPDALAIARSLDDERKRGNLRGPLHGIP